MSLISKKKLKRIVFAAAILGLSGSLAIAIWVLFGNSAAIFLENDLPRRSMGTTQNGYLYVTASACHLNALHQAARKHGLKITTIIFAPELKTLLFKLHQAQNLKKPFNFQLVRPGFATTSITMSTLKIPTIINPQYTQINLNHNFDL